ncbi:RagB/SusD family nutrient uptake outer membrane protein [Pedobacter sp. HDW13]|uniref:RagB/SusD family nutrient uptake outer membrane protein n=1 Tax=Pedobacter sp. HDW13 TaxID=2714940 RepID=UPI00140C11E9|nr:RagB/SusD family nutrient uptake outer membrane protein [Pedobacter sp. HDW13]QIL38348.1 RagB/SusD family nutrient uptake outer membrane protein [Pedobacter sp. HDW13]
MKKIFLMFLVMSLSFISCKKFLDTEPTDFLAEKYYYNSKDKMMVALAGVYQPLATNRLYGGSLINEFGAITDETFVRWNYITTGVVVNSFDSGSPVVNGLWVQCYTGIERANVLLDNIQVPELSEEDRNAFKGEALFLRAYYHFLLASYFGDVPLKLTRSEDPSNLKGNRTPARDVFAQVIADMETAIPLVRDIDKIGHSGRVSKTAVQGILARVCLTRAGAAFASAGDSKVYYQAALKWAKEVVSSGKHKLLETFNSSLTNSAYSQVFINMHRNVYNIGESMWEVEFLGDGTDGKGNLGTLGNNPGITTQFSVNEITNLYGYNYNNFNVSPQFVDLYEPGDLRRGWSISPFGYQRSRRSGDATDATDQLTKLSKVYVDYNTVDKGNFGYQVGKWRREMELSYNKINSNTQINFAILRYSDVLLMLAEAENEVNGPTQVAYDAINQVRRRAFGEPVNATSSTPFSSIQHISLQGSGSGSGSGYLRDDNVTVTVSDPSGGTGAVLKASVDQANGKISGVYIENPGRKYSASTTIQFSTPWPASTPDWQPNTNYAINSYVRNGANYYHVTKAGRSTNVGPTQTGVGAISAVGVTGAIFEYAQQATFSTVIVGTTVVDLSGLSQTTLRQALKQERSKELCFEALRKQDLVRWGDFVSTMSEFSQRIRAINNYFNYGHLAFTNATARNLLLPIPAGEIASNKELVQNPGW